MNSLKRRVRQLMRCIPDVLNYGTLLYLGASRKRMQLVELFDGAGYEITILEIWKENVEYLEQNTPCPPGNRRPVRVIQGDVREIGGSELARDRFDIVMWWHGPEHIPFRDRTKTLRKLECMANEFIIIGCPPGDYPQEKARENPHEKHHEKILVEFFYDPDLMSPGWKADISSNNLLAWRKL